MEQPTFDERTIAAVINLIVARIPRADQLLTYELQDGGESLFMKIVVDEVGSIPSEAALDALAQDLDRIAPARHDDYSWMLVFEVNYKIVNSRYGGKAPS